MMPPPLPKNWHYDRLSGTLFIWNGSFYLHVMDWSQRKFRVALPEEVKKIIIDKMLSYHEEIEEEKQKKREEELQNVIDAVLNSDAGNGET